MISFTQYFLIHKLFLYASSRLNLDLCLAMVRNKVDLMVIEGMGRSLHTNLHAKMKCECLKLAVVKNRWLARRLGGDMYAVICKYEPAVEKIKATCKQDFLNNTETGIICQDEKEVCPCTEGGAPITSPERKEKTLEASSNSDDDENNAEYNDESSVSSN